MSNLTKDLKDILSNNGNSDELGELSELDKSLEPSNVDIVDVATEIGDAVDKEDVPMNDETYTPEATFMRKPARAMRAWERTSASAGSSFRVTKSCWDSFMGADCPGTSRGWRGKAAKSARRSAWRT